MHYYTAILNFKTTMGLTIGQLGLNLGTHSTKTYNQYKSYWKFNCSVTLLITFEILCNKLMMTKGCNIGIHNTQIQILVGSLDYSLFKLSCDHLIHQNNNVENRWNPISKKNMEVPCSILLNDKNLKNTIVPNLPINENISKYTKLIENLLSINSSKKDKSLSLRYSLLTQQILQIFAFSTDFWSINNSKKSKLFENLTFLNYHHIKKSFWSKTGFAIKFPFFRHFVLVFPGTFENYWKIKKMNSPMYQLDSITNRKPPPKFEIRALFRHVLGK
ncbi:Uncharacterized protein FWK35_00004778 [Aphis craccivora]|uniref:Uncharacterized protein n=1 Tax=Aphis craccivora TaxID=307492 RepID=A0A6G0ZG87_APHCR|nr:Uncharacterized protein FWK35_00004778 [Aphis craccivora]